MNVTCAVPVAASILLLLFVQSFASSHAAATDYQESLQQRLRSLLESGADASTDSRLLISVADLYLKVGDDVLTETLERVAAYESGVRAARRALVHDETNAEAHFLFAANMGSAAQLQGLAASARIVLTLKTHVRRAIELQPHHAPSLHMMGRMLDELPWLLGGDARKALEYLVRAVDADPSYAHARLDLGKAYQKRGRRDDARRELRAVMNMTDPNNPYAWSRRYRPEAERLLAEFERGGKE